MPEAGLWRRVGHVPTFYRPFGQLDMSVFWVFSVPVLPSFLPKLEVHPWSCGLSVCPTWAWKGNPPISIFSAACCSSFKSVQESHPLRSLAWLNPLHQLAGMGVQVPVTPCLCFLLSQQLLPSAVIYYWFVYLLLLGCELHEGSGCVLTIFVFFVLMYLFLAENICWMNV